MDISSSLASAGMSGTFVAVVLLAWRIFKAVNHKKCKSNCCGKETVVAIDVSETEPSPTPSSTAPQDSSVSKV